jgi:hypothetical protein
MSVSPFVLTEFLDRAPADKIAVRLRLRQNAGQQVSWSGLVVERFVVQAFRPAASRCTQRRTS